MSMTKSKVGIVMLTYNRADVTALCLRSLSKAKTEIDFELYILDNASRTEEYESIRRDFDELSSKGSLKGMLDRSEINTGFPQGNNMGIRSFLDREDITHICLLNNDVIVTDYWLDRLLAKGREAIGPVTNACGNEQTIPIPFTLQPDDFGSIEVAGNFAKKRYDLFSGSIEQTDWLGFFCFLATKELFATVGLLDERFGRGGFEDDDFCIRLLEKGYEMWISREVYIYHWGTASFMQIPLPKLLKHIEGNKKIFEAKYGVPWVDRKWLPLKSFLQDMNHLLRGNENRDTLEIFNLYYKNAEMLAKNIAISERESAATSTRVTRVIATPKLRIPLKSLKKAVRLLFSRKNIVFLTRYPKTADLQDGYFQRINAVDRILSEMNRFYVDYSTSYKGFGILFPKMVKIKEGVWELRLNSKNPFQLACFACFAVLSGRSYFHSILRLQSGLHKAIYLLSRKRILDVHGSVPEEFVLHDDADNGRKFFMIERFATRNANVIIVVSQSMADHLQKKHGLNKNKFIVVPIFSDSQKGRLQEKPFDRNVIYCGGLQKWQQVKKMLEYVHGHKTYHFTFLVPNPSEFEQLYLDTYHEKFPGVAKSVPSDEVVEYYKKNNFGLVLRENIVVNKVACPTKLIEYLQNDVVPIVDTEDIGDFKRLGYEAVSYMNEIPGDSTWRNMTLKNKEVMEKLREVTEKGMLALKKGIE